MALKDTVYAILAGDYPDPSLVRVGNHYYLTNSANTYAPSLLIWQSTDLLTWTPVVNALDSYDQDIWAPDITYHAGRFYIYYTTSGRNKVIWSDRIEGPWSGPIDLNVPHIDPGHVVDSDGKRYLYLSGGHVVPLADDGLSTAGELKKVYSGWPIPSDWRIEGEAEEGPKLFWRDGWCYLVTAQGGTAGPSTSHMVVIARSRSVTGPWENCPHNPILRTWSRDEPWWSAGHATIFSSTDENEWWIVYHAYKHGEIALGRHTLLRSIAWSPDGWPIIGSADSDTSSVVLPSLSDSFSDDTLGWQWRFFGELDKSRYAVGDGTLKLTARGNRPGRSSPPLVIIPRDSTYEAEVTVEVSGEGAEAGLLIFYDDRWFTGLGVSGKTGLVLPMSRHTISFRDGAKSARVKLLSDRGELDYFVQEAGGSWKKLPHGLDISGAHHNTFGGFMGQRVALYCLGEGTATFSNFVYRPLG